MPNGLAKGVQMPDQRRTSIGESTLTIRWWAVLLVFLGLFGFLFNSTRDQDKLMANLDSRIAVNENRYSTISNTLDKLEITLREIQADLRKDRLRNDR